MKAFCSVSLAVAVLLPAALASQSTSPVADAFRAMAQRHARNLIASAEEMPADKYGFKPTPAQMTFGEVVTHLAEGNDLFCGRIGGVTPPKRDSVASTDPKAKLVARMKETFQFCDSALAKVDDSKLAEKLQVPFGEFTRATLILITSDDWADHYSQAAIYLRLNGLLPPTAKKPM